MDDGIPVTSASFADEETWFQLIGSAGRTFSFMHAVDGFAEAAGTNCAKGNDFLMKQILKKSQMSSWILLARIPWRCEIFLVFYWQFNIFSYVSGFTPFCQYMQLTMVWLLEGCFWRLLCYLFLTFLRENELGLLPSVFMCFVEQNEDFYRRKYSAVGFQSDGCVPPFAVRAKG